MREAICNEHEAMLTVDIPDFILMISQVCESVKHPNDVDCRLNSGNLRDTVRFQKYVTDMRLDCTWGSSLEIHSAASVLNRQIQVYGTCEKTGQSVLLGVAVIQNGLTVYDNAHYEALKAIHEPIGYNLSLPRMNQMIGTGTPNHRLIQSTSGNNSTKFCRGGMRCEQENAQATHDQTATATLLPQQIVNQSGLDPGTTAHILPGPRDATEYISPELDNMLNMVDTLRCVSSESDPLVFMSMMDMSAPENCHKLKDSWGSEMRRDLVDRTLKWDGDKNILSRHTGSLVVMTVKPCGHEKTKHKCRLPHLVSLVASGLVDILVAPEANLDEERARHATQFVTHVSGGTVGTKVALTSTVVSTMEHICAGSTVTKTTIRGILVLMRNDLFHKLISVKQFTSGRVLHMRILAADNLVLNIIAIYGVSAPLQTTPKRKLNADVHHTVNALCEETQHECTIVMGDLNTVTRDQD